MANKNEGSKPVSQSLLDKAEVMRGKPYIFGFEVNLDDPNPKSADCSELVEWVCYQCKVIPKVPDGARFQKKHCENHELLIEIEEAINIPGALLFVIDPENDHYHVAFSVGDGKNTFEARGKKYKIGNYPVHNRGWTHAGLIPGVDYSDWVIEE